MVPGEGDVTVKQAEPEEMKRGIMDLAKRVAGRAAEEARGVRRNPMPDRTPGVRWLRRHRRADPRTATSCRCAGCQCTRSVAAAGPCNACGRGRHPRSLVSKRERRAAAGPNRSVRKVDPRRRTPAQRGVRRHRPGYLDTVKEPQRA